MPVVPPRFDDRRPLNWLRVALFLSISVSVVSTVALMVLHHEPAASAVEATALPAAQNLLRPSGAADSWEPMLLAYGGTKADVPRSLYAPFFDQGIKFQYPPASLLPFTLLPDDILRLESANTPLGVTPNETFLGAVGRGSLAAVWFSILLSVALFELSVRHQGGRTTGWRLGWRSGVALLVACTFYPLIRAHSLGQVQVFLNALVAAAIFFEFVGFRRLAGVCVGICCLFKPQYGLVLVWALARRRWHEASALAITLGIVGLLSLFVFGWQSHLDYLVVLREIGGQGEVFWPNQSFNGLVNRFLYNGDPLQWTATAYAPYSFVVHAATVITSAAMVLAVLAARRFPLESSAARLDWLAVLLVATMASPVAWEHHYGILLPIFAVAVPILLTSRVLGGMTGAAVAVAFLSVGSALLRPALFIENRLTGLVLSHLFLGALALLTLLLLARYQASGRPA